MGFKRRKGNQRGGNNELTPVGNANVANANNQSTASVASANATAVNATAVNATPVNANVANANNQSTASVASANAKNKIWKNKSNQDKKDMIDRAKCGLIRLIWVYKIIRMI